MPTWIFTSRCSSSKSVLGHDPWSSLARHLREPKNIGHTAMPWSVLSAFVRRFTAGRATDLILHDQSLQPCPTQLLPNLSNLFLDIFNIWLVVFVSHTAKFHSKHVASLLFMNTFQFALFVLSKKVTHVAKRKPCCIKNDVVWDHKDCCVEWLAYGVSGKVRSSSRDSMNPLVKPDTSNGGLGGNLLGVWHYFINLEVGELWSHSSRHFW